MDTKKQSRLFLWLASITALLTLGLIIFGAVVRVTDSGLGCGNEWPLCNGTIIPPLDNLTAWIEWLHRLFAVLIGLFGLATLAVAIGAYRKSDKTVLGATVLAAVLFAMQSALGAIVVIFDLPPTFVTLHLGTAMLLLGALLVSSMVAWYRPHSPYPSDHVTTLVYANTAFSLIIILTGALVRGSGATLACTDWPLCYGRVLPLEQGHTAIIHMFHRFAVFAFGLTLLLMTWQVWRLRAIRLMRQLTVGAWVAYCAQVVVGALFVLSVAGPEWGALHVGLAAMTWASLVVLSVVEYRQTQTFIHQQDLGWKPQSEMG